MAKVTASTSSTGAVTGAGKKAPSFELPASTGGTISLKELLTNAPAAVVYFYPRADTQGCTKEACGFRDASAEYANLKVPVVGVSPDPAKAVTRFAQKYSLGFPLLADEDHTVADAYGVWQEKKHVWAEVHGRDADDLRHWERRQGASRFREREAAGARRRSVGLAARKPVTVRELRPPAQLPAHPFR